ncbi:hypothetical protein [Aurantiacibacter xanthus]|nr:hypothetical protein [Aurantiacibacter xanthus]
MTEECDSPGRNAMKLSFCHKYETFGFAAAFLAHFCGSPAA